MSNARSAPMRDEAGSFGPLLRHWRQARRLSQLGLSVEAGISSRHLCFLETGRSRPSREMVQALGAALHLSPEARDTLHGAAGFAVPLAGRGLDAAQLQHARGALEFILRQQEPYPALVIDGRWDVVLRNDAAQRIFAPFRRAYGMDERSAGNAMHVVFHPRGLRPFIVNWTEFAGELLQALHREAAQGSREASLLRDEILRYPDLPPGSDGPREGAGAAPLTAMRLREGARELAFFTMLTTFSLPRNPALLQLRVESFFPADDGTAGDCRALAASPP